MAEAEPDPKQDDKNNKLPTTRTGRIFHFCRETFINVSVVLLVRLGLIVSFVILFLWLPAPWLWQFVQTRIDDQDWLYDSSKEGLIVVDSPQIFTRERLVNQRLRDSDWIDSQLEAVNEMLEAGKFGNPDTVIATQKILRLSEQAPSEQGETPAAAIDLSGVEGLLKPDPLTVFEDAQMYREMLTQSRYEAILDDAHDIGSNTLQRLNFRMTISPGRSMSDSLAAVTITIDEPDEPEWLFHHYGRLLIETRAELEATVRRLFEDRSRIFLPGAASPYALHQRSEAALEAVYERELESLSASFPASSSRYGLGQLERDLLEQAMLYQTGSDEALVAARIKGYLSAFGELGGLQEQVLGDGEEEKAFLARATGIAIATCDQPFNLWSILGEQLEDPSVYDSWLTEYNRLSSLHQTLAAHRNAQRPQSSRPQGAPPQGGGPQEGGSASAATPGQAASPRPAVGGQPQSRPVSADNSTSNLAEARFLEVLHRDLPPVPCRRDYFLDLPRAKLRLIAVIKMLNEGLSDDSSCQKANTAGRRAALLTAAGLLFGTERSPATMQAARATCPVLTELVEEADSLTLSPSAKVAGLEQIGLARMVLEELQTTAADSNARHRKLTDYFHIALNEGCDLTNCSIVVRTLAEQFLHQNADIVRPHNTRNHFAQANNGTSGSGQAAEAPGALTTQQDIVRRRAEDIGREEALRLFAELSCFANARSYTVWPRTGARQQVVQSDQDSVSLISKIFNPLNVNADAQQSHAKRHHIDLVFGIGDGGQPVDTRKSGIAPSVHECDAPFFWMLNRLQPRGEFVPDYFLNKEIWQAADDPIRTWYEQRVCLLGVTNRVAPWFEEITTPSGAPFRSEDDMFAALTERCNAPTEAMREPGEKALAELKAKARLHDVAAHTRQLRQNDTNISWIVAPQQIAPLSPKAHVARSIPLSAIVSVPSWWPSARITIRTCWLRPKEAMIETAGAEFCKATPFETKKTGFELLDRRAARLHGLGRSETTISIPLPSNAQDVLPKLGFFLIRAPYLDSSNGQVQIESGRKARIQLTGSRLWKNPKVRLGSQWHSTVEVLPDMEGIIATFDCVSQIARPETARVHFSGEKLIHVPTATGMSAEDATRIQRATPPSSGPPEAFAATRQVQIWTSEGQTSSTPVQVRAFRPSYLKDGAYEQPCWASDDLPRTSNLDEPPEQ